MLLVYFTDVQHLLDCLFLAMSLSRGYFKCVVLNVAPLLPLQLATTTTFHTADILSTGLQE